MASTDARPVPIKNTAFRAVFPILDADGDLVTAASALDSEVSKDEGTFTDCSNEATEIATSSGMYYLDLTSTEMNADCVAVIVKTSTSGAKTTVLVFYPQESGDIKVDVQSWLATAVNADTAGYPSTTIKVGTGTGEINTSSGAVPIKGNVKKAVAFTKFSFMMTDSTNHAPATGKTVTATISKDGGAFASLNSADTVTEIGNGIYEVDLSSTDTNANNLILRFTASACDDTFERIVTYLA